MGVGILPLSGSTNGKPILLSGGTDTLHTAAATVATTDQVYLWLCNSTGAECRVDLYHGGGTAAELVLYQYLVPPNSRLVFVMPGFLLNNGLAVYAIATVTNIVTASGFVVRQLTGT